jgi:hypothetical protein
MLTKFSLKNVNESDHLRELGVDGEVILKWILNSVRVYGLDSSGCYDNCNGTVSSARGK